jgi:hypothetical protein
MALGPALEPPPDTGDGGRDIAPPRPRPAGHPHRRPRPSTARPVRGEPDVPERPYPSEWRIDPATRRAGLQGLARARAALAATRPAGEVDAA